MADLKPKTTTDWVTIIAGFLGAIKLLAAAPPFEVEIAQETIDAIINLVSWIAVAYAVWRNNKKPSYPETKYEVNKYNKWE